MSRRLELPKPLLSIGYVTEHPEDIQTILEQLTLEDRREPTEPLVMDTSIPITLDDSNYGRWKVEMMATLVIHGLEKIVMGSSPKPA
jgi:hypothetical protein